MQTVFLVWLPGLGGLLFGAGIGAWLAGKGYLAWRKARAIVGSDRLVIAQAELLQEINGSSVVLPEDITNRIEWQIARTEAVTRKELT